MMEKYNIMILHGYAGLYLIGFDENNILRIISIENKSAKEIETMIKEEVKDLFEALDLPLDILPRKSYELSGGQKVRAMLALVLVSKPDILLLDEPFGDLDPKTLRTVSNSLKRICKEFGTTIVMVSHNTDFIKELSNRAVFIDQGLLKDDTEDVERLVDDFIGFCHADYLM